MAYTSRQFKISAKLTIHAITSCERTLVMSSGNGSTVFDENKYYVAFTFKECAEVAIVH